MKKILFFIACLVIIILTPLIYIYISTYVQTNFSDKAYLSIRELKGVDTVYVDNAYKGRTPLITIPITAGHHTISIKNSEDPNDYYSFQKIVSFEKGINTFITIQLGPNSIYTFYNILSPQKTVRDSGVVVFSDDLREQNATITLNGNTIDANHVYSQPAGMYQLTFQEDGYIGINNQITLSKNYIIQDDIHLFKNPL